MIYLSIDSRNFQKGFDLGGESEAISSLSEIKRLDAEVIAREKQIGRPDRKSQIAKANIPFSRFTQSVPSSSYKCRITSVSVRDKKT